MLQKSNQVKDVYMIQNLLYGHYRLHIVSAAIDLGIFEWLEGRKSTREELNTHFELDGQFTGSFFQSLVDLELLTLEEENFKNSSLASKFFISNSPYYLGDLVLHTLQEDEKWRHLTKVLKSETYPQPPLNDLYLNARLQFALYEQIDIIHKIKQWKGYKNATSILDVSNPAGIFAFSLCAENPFLKGEVIAPIEQTEDVEKYIKDHKLELNVIRKNKTLQEFLDGEVETKYDIVIFSHALYPHRRELLPTYRKLHDHMNSGGLVISNHWFCSPGCGGANQGLNDLNKAVSIGGHPLCHVERYKTFFTEAGFTLLDESVITSMCGDSSFHMAIRNEDE